MVDSYVYTCEVDGIVRYVGKGRGNRVNSHMTALSTGYWCRTNRFYSNLDRAVREGCTVTFQKIVEDLTGDEAVSTELEVIKNYPRDQLWNTKFDGHPRITDEKYRSRLSAAQFDNWDDGRRVRMSATMRDKWTDPDYRRRRAEAFSRPEVKERQSLAMRARYSNG